MMRIGITSFASAGGSGIIATELGLALARRGDFEVHFISSAMPHRLRHFEPNIFFHEVETAHYPPFPHAPYSLALASKMTEVSRYHQLDLLHVHYAIPHAASAFLAQQMIGRDAVSVITTLHGTDITLVGQEPSFYPLTRFVIESSDRVTAVSEYLREETETVFRVHRPINVIGNFVDTSLFVPRPDLRASNPLSPDGLPVLMHASNFRPVKNVHHVVEVFARVRETVDCRLVLVGDGPERNPAERLARRLGVEEHVSFLGSQESMEELLAMAHVVLQPSEQESFGLVALEAMSCGTPVVASRRGGLTEVVREGRTGYLYDPHDVAGMAAAVCALLGDPATATAMGEAAREVAKEKHCISCVIKDYIALYEEVVQERTGRLS